MDLDWLVSLAPHWIHHHIDIVDMAHVSLEERSRKFRRTFVHNHFLQQNMYRWLVDVGSDSGEGKHLHIKYNFS